MNFVKETLVGLPPTPTEAGNLESVRKWIRQIFILIFWHARFLTSSNFFSEFEDIKRQKAHEAAKRIEEEKKSALEAKIKSESLKKHQPFSKTHILDAVSKKQLFPVTGNGATSKQSKKDVKIIGQGFVATAGQETVDDDPLGQQIHNLKQFIKQAKAAGKFDDARILENNLKDFQVSSMEYCTIDLFVYFYIKSKLGTWTTLGTFDVSTLKTKILIILPKK